MINVLNFTKRHNLYSRKSSIIAPLHTEAYLRLCQLSMMESIFVYILSIFAKKLHHRRITESLIRLCI